MSLLSELFQRASWGGIAFPFVESTQKGARAVTENEAWLRDGAELVQGGRKAYRGKFSAAFFPTIEGYTDLFPGTFENLLARFDSEAEDTLSHPLLGSFRAIVTDWEPKFSAKTLNGAYIDFEWIEQRASSVGVIALMSDRGTSDPRTQLAAHAAAADTQLAAVGAAPKTSLTSVTSTVLVKVAKPLPYTEITRALGSVEAAVEAARLSLAAVAATGANALALWSARATLARMRVASARLRAGLLPDPSRQTVYLTTRSMTFAELSRAVYGTPFRAADLRAANAIAADVVRAGRAITVLP